MTAFSRALILAGLVAATGASGALADTANRDVARAPNDSANYASVLQEGRASSATAAPAQEEKSFLLDRRSSEYNHR
jgi:hypothetical protein